MVITRVNSLPFQMAALAGGNLVASTRYEWRCTKDTNCYAKFREGQWKVYILRKHYKKREKAQPLFKGPIATNGFGCYRDEEAAEGEVALWRLRIEGYQEVGGRPGEFYHPRRQEKKEQQNMDVDQDETARAIYAKGTGN